MVRLRSLLLLSTLVACGPTSVSPTLAADAQEDVVLREAEADSRAIVARDGELVIDLEAVPGTGYSWALVEHDASQLELLGDEMVEGDDDEPGARERHMFRFRALSAGTSAIELHYRRPFEKDKPPEQTYRVTIEVE